MGDIKIIENADKELVKGIRAKIKEHGGHCCCAIQFNDDNICMCKDFKQMIKEKRLGWCDCGLYEIIEKEAAV